MKKVIDILSLVCLCGTFVLIGYAFYIEHSHAQVLNSVRQTNAALRVKAGLD